MSLAFEVWTVGADQTNRTLQDLTAGYRQQASTQPGSAGGVMSWTTGASDFWLLGAIAFKPTAAAAVTPSPILMGQSVHRRIVTGMVHG